MANEAVQRTTELTQEAMRQFRESNRLREVGLLEGASMGTEPERNGKVHVSEEAGRSFLSKIKGLIGIAKDS